ncbi:MAG: FtsH protease activity modulator HflK [Thermodesulfobacteriota bacterium]|nr:FtsH protease activity modulator HflK [Thermodesulfobacteriota bacterium]
MNWDWDKLREKQERYEKKHSTGGGIPTPPDMEELLEKFRNFKFPRGIIIIIVLCVLFVIFFGSSLFFTVDVDEVGVIQRFGKYERISQPGLNFKLPAGIEKFTKVKIKRVFKEEFGFKTVAGYSNARFSDGSADVGAALMLTGDLNVAIVPWIVQYRISDPYNYLFKVKNVTTILRDLTEATMRTVVGDRSINEVIGAREEIAVAARVLLQTELKQAETGIHVVTIEMKKTNVPEPVQSSFNEVNEAVQEKEQMIYKAKEEYNKAVPAARGEARRVVKAAEGYALNRVNRAKGDASRFTDIYNEYKKAEDVTKRRLYLETMADVLPKIGNKYVIDSDQKNLLPLLNIGGGAGTLSPVKGELKEKGNEK